MQLRVADTLVVKPSPVLILTDVYSLRRLQLRKTPQDITRDIMADNRRIDEDTITAVARSAVSAYLMSNPGTNRPPTSATSSSSSPSSIVAHSSTVTTGATRLAVTETRGPACSSMARVL